MGASGGGGGIRTPDCPFGAISDFESDAFDHSATPPDEAGCRKADSVLYQPAMDPATVQFGKAAGDYARHRQGFPPALFDRLQGWGIGRPGQTVIDLGTGTGTLAQGFARRGCNVLGVDKDDAMIEEASRLAREEGLRISWVTTTAENTGLPGHGSHVVSAGQCWHWFDAPAVAAEARRLLMPGGWLVVAHFDWIPLPGNIAWCTEQLIQQHNPAWQLGGGTGLHAGELADLAQGGFINLESFSFDVPVEYTPEAWRGRIRASAGIGASLPPAAVEAFDAEHAAMLATDFPGDILQIPHRVFAVLGQSPH